MVVASDLICCWCKDYIIPSYVPESQKDKFVKLYLKENYECK